MADRVSGGHVAAAVVVLLGFFVPAAEGARELGASSSEQLAAGAPRILYAADWSGTSQIYAIDPSGRRPTGQLTVGRAAACLPGSPCGFAAPNPSPDARRLLFWDYAIQGPFASSLYTSLADGRKRRRLGLLRAFTRDAVWSPDSRRIAYTGKDGIHIVRADGSSDRRVRLDDTDEAPAWSADGRWIGFMNVSRTNGSKTLLLLHDGAVTVVARSENGDLDFRWSPRGDRLAYTSPAGFVVTRPPSKSGWRVATTASEYAWSPDGRLVAFTDPDGLKLANVATRAVRLLTSASPHQLAWSPDGRQIAYTETKGGVSVANVGTGTTRNIGPGGALGLAWSPDSQSLAYGVSTGATTDFGSSLDVRLATLSGATRTVVAGAGAFGGAIRGFTWTRPRSTVRYRAPASRSLATISPDRLVARWPIERLATDGGRVAYVACGHVFVWTPAAGTVVQREATTSLSPACASPSYYTSYRLYSLALAGERVAYGNVYGGNGRVWWLGGTRGSRAEPFTLADGHATNGLAYGDVSGELAGSGDFLVFSFWREDFASDRSSAVTIAQEVRRALPPGCPCPTITASPGPLVPFDVDGPRVVAGGSNETWVLNEFGARVLSIPVSADAGQMSGRDLVVVRKGELLHYHASTGALVHAWPLPNVSTGRECASPNSNRCYSEQAQLVLEDAARNLVAYVLDGQVHVLRLVDGADAVVAPGTLARFIDNGLVYADGARLQLVPNDRLPLR